MNWLLIAIIAYFLYAIVFIIDKFLLSQTNLQPSVYAFYIGIFSGLAVLVLIPFDFSIISVEQIIISFIAGILFVLANLFFYKSIQIGEVSRITPIIGGAIPIFTLILTYLFLGERLTINQLIAFCLFVLGGIIMLWPRKKIRVGHGMVKTLLIKRLPLAILSALLFAGSFVLTKFIYNELSFINSFIWIRIGGIIGSLLLLFSSNLRKAIFQVSKSIKIKTVELAVFNKCLSALAFILLNYAIYLGSVTLVNALQGVQYVLLLFLAFFLSKKFPEIIKEQIGREVIIKKIFAILFISIGLGILVF
ncbi:EamA family transporter [Patescibacteria group bacterium]|nr:EamA family transporter [Patescibacteria group bacterium]